MSCPADCTTIRTNTSSVAIVSGLVDVDGEYVNTATGTAYLIDPEDNSVLVSGAFSYVTNSNGNYRAILSAVELSPAKTYVIRAALTADGYQWQDDEEVLAE